MKITANKNKPTFEPVTLNITLETEDELRMLWTIFNTPSSAFKYVGTCNTGLLVNGKFALQLFDTVDNLV